MTDDKSPGRFVKDEDNVVDQQLKSRIVNVRRSVDDREDLLFVQAPLNGGIDAEKQLRAWGTTVRQYLRAIRPLLTTSDVRSAPYYWESVELGEMTAYPPEDDIPWSAFYGSGNTQHLKQELGLPPNFEPPAPKAIEFTGLRSIIQNPSITFQWTVDVNPGIGGNTERTLTVQRPPEKRIYERAVSQADEFLQQAGVGLDIGFKEISEDETDVF